jgi:nicotinamidase-related amidase
MASIGINDTAQPFADSVPPWLMVVDMQHIFGDPDSGWFTPRFGEIVAPIQQLVALLRPRICFTRFVAPEMPLGAWVPYYQRWPFALQSPDSHAYQLVEAFSAEDGVRVDRTTFGKWTPALEATIPVGHRLLLTGVSTDCCVLSTALAAADSGRFVEVVADACAGINDTAHAQALEVMSLYQPLIKIVHLTDVLAQLSGSVP